MEYLWSSLLYLLFLIPILILVYIFILRRRKPNAVRFSSLSLIKTALPKQSQWKRHLPFALFLLAISSLIMALARPTSTVTLPSSSATIILALDVSRSMCSTDIAPNRLEAAKAAAMQFILQQDDNTQIGIVAFAGFAVVAQPPTTDRDLLANAIRNITTARRTAIGEGILMSLDTIAGFDDSVVSPYSQLEVVPLPEGQYVPAIIVLLTDGVSTTGIHPLEAAIMAQQRGVRVYTIGFGTANNESPMNCSFSSPHGFDQFTDPQFFGGGGGGGGGQFRREIDEETLKAVSGMTGGEYYLAESSEQLQEVFDNLPKQIFTVTETTEISVFFVIFAAVFILLAVIFSILWNPLL
jgi:Ca-activated chloride channel family protein